MFKLREINFIINIIISKMFMKFDKVIPLSYDLFNKTKLFLDMCIVLIYGDTVRILPRKLGIR